MSEPAIKPEADLPSENQVGDVPVQKTGDVADLLAAIAISFRESIARFEDTVGTITEIVVKQTGGNDRNLVMALQNFDRLHQEFATLGEIVAHVARDHHSDASASSTCDDVIATIPIEELKDRVAYHFKTVSEDPAQLEESEDVEF
jgi:hypothetical protein